MNRLYSSPLRVYLCLGFLALVGIYSGLGLPVSLFPNSTKPDITIRISYGSITAEDFLNTYGRNLETQLHNISGGRLEVEKINSTYDSSDVRYDVLFKWGADPKEAQKEVEIVTNAFSSQFPLEIRQSVRIWGDDESTGFLAVSYFSRKKSLDDLYKYLDPIITPQVSKVKDASEVELWNPSRKEIQVELNPEKMALLSLYPRDVAPAINTALNGNGGGTVSIGLDQLDITMTRQLKSVDDMAKILVSTPTGRAIHLSDIARIDLGVPRSSSRSFKTSGAQSLILYATPRPGGNIKKMSEDILDIVKKTGLTLPEDIQYKVLVDPSEFIRSAVHNVLREVLLAAFLAVCVLFLFIGNIKNVITAAIEIPMSIVLAFILMKLTGINLNLISLGGLALSAGMNVDASVVVMENIFRHFEDQKEKPDLNTRFRLVCEAVNEVKFPVIASTMASLVVFLPLAFMSGLSNALLSDLALAVVFSHGFSAIVALVLVPTVRLHLMSMGSTNISQSPIEKILKTAERFYASSLQWFIRSRVIKTTAYGALVFSLIGLTVFVIPRLRKEIIGRPDTDWIILMASTEGNTLVKQMETQSEEVEARLLERFGDKIQYTFVQTRSPNRTQIMARLTDKKYMTTLWKEIEKYFSNTPQLKYQVFPWNPSELSIPDPPHLRITIKGGEVKDRSEIAQQLSDLLEEKKSLTHIWTNPGVSHRESIVLKPHFEQWAILARDNQRLQASDLADISRVATVGRKIGDLPVEGRLVPVVMQYPQDRVVALEDLAAFPLGLRGHLLPMKALADLRFEEVLPAVFREDQRELIDLNGKMSEEDKIEGPARAKAAQELISQWMTTHKIKEGISVNFEDAEDEMNDALSQLAWAAGLSVLLIFVTMVLQFGDVMNALIVLAAIPLGFIGVLTSLYIFKSTLSLNSVLGVILLNGIAVANSIILVDFLKRLVDKGLNPREAALQAAQKRLRPILMTSLTTALGMLPVALGWGEGGKILQPLGVAVVGGLGFSVFMTLFIVPSLQVYYLEWKNRRQLKALKETQTPTLSPLEFKKNVAPEIPL